MNSLLARHAASIRPFARPGPVTTIWPAALASLLPTLSLKNAIVLSADAGEITNRGRDFLQDFGLTVEAARPAKRLLCRPCLDWSERRPHLAGRLGAALQERLFGLGWLERSSGRAVVVTSVGRLGLSQTFGLDF